MLRARRPCTCSPAAERCAEFDAAKATAARPASIQEDGLLVLPPRLRPTLLRPLPRVTQTRACDTEPAGSSYATGFVVDKVRGLALELVVQISQPRAGAKQRGMSLGTARRGGLRTQPPQ